MQVVKTRKQYRTTFKLCSMLAVLALVLAAALTYLNMQTPSIKYFATTRGGTNIPLDGMSTPLYSPRAITDWSSVVVRKVLSLNFASLQQQQQNAADYFTESGYKDFSSALTKSGLFDAVVNKHLTISAVAGEATLISWPKIDGKQYYNVKVPVLETIESASESRSRHLVVNLRVSWANQNVSSQVLEIDGFHISRN